MRGWPFYPGIEVSWQIRHEDLFIAPFRISHRARSTYLGENEVVRAGHFSRQMAVPWQADFLECRAEKYPEGTLGWWPSQRPDDVVGPDMTMQPWARTATGVLDDKKKLVAIWHKLGFVGRRGDHFVEVERTRGRI